MLDPKIEKKANCLVFIFLFSIMIDIFTKNIVETNLSMHTEIMIIPNILSFEKVYNTGAAFSIMQNNLPFLITISIVTLMLIFWYITKKHKELSCLEISALSLISGGAFGNLIDRLTNSYVIDFIQLEFINFPIFNFADIFINIGVIILIVSMFILKK